MTGEHSRESVRSFLVHGMARAKDDLDASVGNRGGQPARGGHVSMVELAGYERAWNLNPTELAPQRFHHTAPIPRSEAARPATVLPMRSARICAMNDGPRLSRPANSGRLLQ